MIFHARNYRLVFDFLAEVEAFAEAMKIDTAVARAAAERDLFTQAAALYREGFESHFRDALKRMNCDEAAVEACPVIISAFFAALTTFADPVFGNPPAEINTTP